MSSQRFEPIPMPKNSFQAAGRALDDAQQLVCDVRDIAPEDVWSTVASWNPTRIVSTVIALAAMVPDDRPVAELLAWLDPAILRSVS